MASLILIPIATIGWVWLIWQFVSPNAWIDRPLRNPLRRR